MIHQATIKTELPPEVVLGQPSDFDEVFDVFAEGYRENAIYALDLQKACAWLLMGLHRQNSCIGLIRGPKGIEAMCAVYLASYWYSDEYFVEEVFNYVRFDHRRTTHAKHLIQFAKWFAESLGKPLLMGILTTSRLAAKERLYERQIPKVGSLFLHGLPWVIDSLAADEQAPHARKR